MAEIVGEACNVAPERKLACEAARRVVGDNDRLTLMQEAFDAFVAACEQPGEPNEYFRRLARQTAASRLRQDLRGTAP